MVEAEARSRRVEYQAVLDGDGKAPGLRKLKAALACIPNNDADYDCWLRVGFAINSALPDGSGLDLWDGWSRQSPKYQAGECALKWHSFSPEMANGVTYRSLFLEAMENGWNPSPTRKLRPRRSRTRISTAAMADITESTEDVPAVDVTTDLGRDAVIVVGSDRDEGQPEPPDDEESCYGLDDDLPAIEITADEHLVRDAVISRLARDPRIYRFGDSLATVSRQPDMPKKLFNGYILRNAGGSYGISLLNDSRLRCLVTEDTDLYKQSKDRNGEFISVAQRPPAWLIENILNHKDYPGFRPLLGVAECPYVGPDRDIVEKSGYDARTGTVLIPLVDVAPLPDHPSQEDARMCTARLQDKLLKDFPFATDVDRAVWLAALLTGIQRPVIQSCVPGFVFNGNKPGCGKGLAIDAIGMIVWGGSIPCSQCPKDSGEADKVMLALALSGISAVHFDNLEDGYQYGDSSMDSALTCTSKGGRVLGESRFVEGVPLRPCWFLSGNNIHPAKAAFRRWLPANLVTSLETPHLRNGLIDLRQHISTHRGKIVRDALVVLKAHADAGYPGSERAPLGSFEEWDRIVRRAVWWSTSVDCLVTQAKAASDSPERLRKIALLTVWKAIPNQERGLTCASLQDRQRAGNTES